MCRSRLCLWLYVLYMYIYRHILFYIYSKEVVFKYTLVGMTTNIVVLEQWQVVPSPGGPIEKLLPLSDFDIIFLRFPIMQLLFFYDLHCSKSHFLGTLVPNLKNSLSLTLKHFSPLAGKTILPLTSGTPFTHYVAGDSVPLTISQSDADFVHLIGNHYRYLTVLLCCNW